MVELSQSVREGMSRRDFEVFLEMLARSAAQHGAEWENFTIEEFLSSASAWTSDMDGYFVSKGECAPTEPTWHLFAEILLAARSYE